MTGSLLRLRVIKPVLAVINLQGMKEDPRNSDLFPQIRPGHGAYSRFHGLLNILGGYVNL